MPEHRRRPNPGTLRPGLLLRGYRGLSALAQPTLPFLLRHRISREKEDRERTMERFGRASAARPAGPLVWFHASSVGETNAILPLMTALSSKRPDLNLLLTTGTRTSAEFARSRMPAGAIHQFVPLDAPRFMRHFLDHWRPDLAILAESEIWPNLILEASERAIPLVLVNARMSNRSFQRWRNWRSLSRPLFNRFQLVLAQDRILEQRFIRLGAQNVVVAGNLKIDAPPPAAESSLLDALRQETAGRQLFLAASTHAGEERILTEVHTLLARRHDRLLTIIAPRHPHRGEEIEGLVKSAGLRPARRSRGDTLNGSTDIYVADTIGELGLFYALAPVAFIGGSLIRHGGQNPVEAVKHGAAVIAGLNVRNFEEAYDVLRRAGACAQVASAGDLAERVDDLLRDAGARKRMTEKGDKAVAEMSGALRTTLEALGDWLPPERA
jgi:3-deoxy-D-manno-octulosonic-acid transferase